MIVNEISPPSGESNECGLRLRQGEYEQQPRGCFVVAKLKGAAAKLAVTVNLGNAVVMLEQCVHSAACQSERQCRRLSSALRHDETKGVGGRLQFPSSAIRYCSRSRGSHLLPTLLAISALRSSIPFQSHHGTIVNFIILCTRLPSAYCLAATRTELRADPRLRPPWAPRKRVHAPSPPASSPEILKPKQKGAHMDRISWDSQARRRMHAASSSLLAPCWSLSQQKTCGVRR